MRKRQNKSRKKSTNSTTNYPKKLSRKAHKIINTLQSKIENFTIIYEEEIRTLKNCQQQNHLFNRGTHQFTLLSYLANTRQVENVKVLFEGNNIPDPLICNSAGESVLYLLVEAFCRKHKSLSLTDQERKQAHLQAAQTLNTFNISDIFMSNISLPSKEDITQQILQLKTIIDEVLKHKREEQLTLASRETGRNPLQEAVYNGNTLMFIQLGLSSEQQFLQRNGENLTALMMAITLKNENILDLVLQHGPTRQLLESTDGNLAVHLACEIGNLKIIQQLLQKEHHTQLESKDIAGRCLLSIAAFQGKLDIIHWLLDTYPEITKAQCASALLWACRGWQKEIVEFLLPRVEPAALLMPGVENYIPLMFLAVPCQARVSENEPSPLENPPIKRETRDDSTVPGPIRDEEALLAYVVDHIEKEKDRATHRNVEIAKLLLEQENCAEQLRAVSNSGNVLHITIKVGDIELLKLLVSYANSSEPFLTRDSRKHIPLNRALATKGYDNLSMIRVLLSVFTNEQLNFRTEGYLPIHGACYLGLLDCIKFIIEQDPEQREAITENEQASPLHFIVAESLGNRRELTEFLLTQTVNVFKKNAYGHTPLHLTCMQGNLEIAKLFLENPLYTLKLLTAKDIYGNTPLYYACLADNIELVEYLIAKGANVNEPNAKGLSAFQWSCLNNKFLLVRYFLNNCQLNDPDMKGPKLAIAFKQKATLDEFRQHKSWKEKVENLQELRSNRKNQASPPQQKISTHPEADHPWESNTPLYINTSGRKFLISQGMTTGAIEQLIAENKENHNRLLASRCAFFKMNQPKSLSFTYFNGALSTDGLLTIEDSHNQQVSYFLFLDEELLKTQCHADILKHSPTRFKFDGYHIKLLDDDKAILKDIIILPDDSSKEITYTHEWKIYVNGFEKYRILLFPINTDQPHGIVYVTGRVIEALHTSGATRNLENRQNSAPLSINWRSRTHLPLNKL